MKPVEAVFAVELFPPLASELHRLLRGLPREAWDGPTACSEWTVKDVAAHLLGGNLGRLSSPRDRPRRPGAPAPQSLDELVALIDRQNAEWVTAAREISPSLLVDLLELTDPQLYDYFKTLPPDAPASIPVSWAGDRVSPNWFDIAREYTEKWLHQQHIREAVGAPLLVERAWLHPVLDTFVRVLPYAYRALDAEDGTVVSVFISGEAGGDWSLLRRDQAWQLYEGAPAQAAAAALLDQDAAWRLFTKGLSPADAEARIQLAGDRTLGAGILRAVAIMA